MTGRTIYLLSDGTGNSAASVHRTNVWRLYQALDLGPDSGQLAFYDDGVGSSGARPWRLLTGALGIGLSTNVKQLYATLCSHYRAGDRIVLIGFSRGAFTARVLADLIGLLGVVPLSNDKALADLREAHPEDWQRLIEGRGELAANIASLAWKVYRRQRTKHQTLAGIWRSLTDKAHERVDTRAFQTLYVNGGSTGEASTPQVVDFVGVWDTVSAYGLPIDELSLAWHKLIYPMRFNDHRAGRHIRFARQALALDEARHTFRPLLWDESPDEGGAPPSTDLLQVWFPGVHADVGGGYPDDSLAHLALQWMIAQLDDCLARDGAPPPRWQSSSLDAINSLARCDAPLHNSRHGLARAYRYRLRAVAAITDQRAETDIDGQTVRLDRIHLHPSVAARIGDGNRAYNPQGLAHLAPDPEDTSSLTCLRHARGNTAPVLDPRLGERVADLALSRKFWHMLGGLAALIALASVPFAMDGLKTLRNLTALSTESIITLLAGCAGLWLAIGQTRRAAVYQQRIAEQAWTSALHSETRHRSPGAALPPISRSERFARWVRNNPALHRRYLALVRQSPWLIVAALVIAFVCLSWS